MAAEVELPEPNRDRPITITAEAANHWTQGVYEVWILRGRCRIVQGSTSAAGDEAVLWIDHADVSGQRESKVIAYLEGNVSIDQEPAGDKTRLTDQTWLGRFFTGLDVQIHASQVAGQPNVRPAIYLRAAERRDPVPAGIVRRTQFTTDLGAAPGSVAAGGDASGASPSGVASFGPAAADSLPPGMRRVEVHPRYNTPVQARWDPVPNTNQWVGVIDGGVMMNIYESSQYGVIDVSADRLVIWTIGMQEMDLTGQTFQDGKIPLEIYMEGNIVFRQGDRVIYAVADVLRRGQSARHRDRRRAADARAGLPGMLRLKAAMVQQIGPDRFYAQDAFLTSSRMGVPGYRIQSGDIYYEDIASPIVDPTGGQQLIDAATGEPMVQHQRMASAQNNFLFLGEVPVLYWPTLATDLEEPTFYVSRAQLKNDRVFGTQILTVQRLSNCWASAIGRPAPDWDLSLDYLSKRGLGHGTTFEYTRDGFLGVPGPAAGLADLLGRSRTTGWTIWVAGAAT